MYANIHVVSVHGASESDEDSPQHKQMTKSAYTHFSSMLGKREIPISTHIIVVLRLCVPPGEKQTGAPRQIC